MSFTFTETLIQVKFSEKVMRSNIVNIILTDAA